jgi:hypothetical protein
VPAEKGEDEIPLMRPSGMGMCRQRRGKRRSLDKAICNEIVPAEKGKKEIHLMRPSAMRLCQQRRGKRRSTR